MQYRHIILFATLISLATGCSSTSPEHATDYAGERQAIRDLAIPPDLTTTTFAPLLVIPDLPVQRADQPEVVTSDTHRVDTTISKPHILLPGTRDQAWEKVLSFWQAQDVQLTETNQSLGILRTTWIEDRSRIADDAVTRTLRSFLDRLYESDQRNQYLMHLTPASNGQTALSVTHYGTQQKILYDIDGDIDKTEWIPRAPEPQHTYNLLNQLAAYCNIPPIAQTAQPYHNSSPQPANGELAIADHVTEAWPLLAHALHQPVFRIQQQDQETGRFIVRYPLPPATKSVLPGLTFRIGDKPEPAEQYQITLQPTQAGAVIQVRNNQDQIVHNTHSTQLLRQIADYFQTPR